MTDFAKDPERAVAEVTAKLPDSWGDFTGTDCGVLADLYEQFSAAYAGLDRVSSEGSTANAAFRATLKAMVAQRAELLDRAAAQLRAFEKTIGAPTGSLPV